MTNAVLDQMQIRFTSVEGSLARLLHRLPGMAYRCAVSPDFKYTLEFASRGCEALLGVSTEEILRNPANLIERMMPEEDVRMEQKILYESLLARKPYEMYYRIMPKGQPMKWVWDKGEGVFDTDGPLYIEGFIMDVTGQKTREQNLWEENQHLRSSIKNSYGLGAIVGKSEAMQDVYSRMLKAAGSDMNVLLCGESGSGKELVARTIHELSGIKGRYVPVNCAAIPEQLLESEFFGHVKGAFSGAISNNAGYLSAANGGTLFLDEIGELPLKLQVKLLRALEDKSYTPVGASETKHSNFRLISATNQDLQEMVRQRAMRSDFYYRIHVLVIQLPPLRARQGDIPLLMDAYAKVRGIIKPIPPSVRLFLEEYSWPGNVRELQNALDRFWTFGETGIMPPIGGADPLLFSPLNRPSSAVPEFTERAGALRLLKDDMEKHSIVSMLAHCGGKKALTAASLGITTRTLQRKIKKYAIAR